MSQVGRSRGKAKGRLQPKSEAVLVYLKLTLEGLVMELRELIGKNIDRCMDVQITATQRRLSELLGNRRPRRTSIMGG